MSHDEGSLREFLERSETPDSPPRILYPIFSTHDNFTFETAMNIAEGVEGELLVLDLLADNSIHSAETTSIGRKLLQAHIDEDHTVDAHLIVEETDSPLSTAITVAQQRNIQLVVFDEHTPELLGEGVRGDAADQMRKKASCDVVSVTHPRSEASVSSVLVPLAGGEHSGLAVVVGGALAAGANAVVELLHVSQAKDDTAQVTELFDTARARLPGSVELDTQHLEAPDVAQAIIDESAHYDVTVIGKPTQNRLIEFITGSVTKSVTDASENAVLTVQRGEEGGFSFENR
ncbi:universal stress protein [Haloarcula japonica]|uniref:universal stress protein n=1 Tax=Haloarcula japonica TaxID=29282 RepID=UPI0039F669CE